MKIVIENKAFHLKFGMKCLRNLGENLGHTSYDQTIAALAVIENISDNITFEQSDLLEAIIEAAVQSHPEYYQLEYTIMDVSLTDFIFTDQTQLAQIIEAFVKSFPQQEGKKKVSKKPVRKTTKKSA